MSLNLENTSENTKKEENISPFIITADKHLNDEARIRILKNAVIDSIITIEETKRSFKSKKLETLRRELMRVLAEAS